MVEKTELREKLDELELGERIRNINKIFCHKEQRWMKIAKLWRNKVRKWPPGSHMR